jgi:hypothetical protein
VQHGTAYDDDQQEDEEGEEGEGVLESEVFVEMEDPETDVGDANTVSDGNASPDADHITDTPFYDATHTRGRSEDMVTVRIAQVPHSHLVCF